jgi:hypothetical protein
MKKSLKLSLLIAAAALIFSGCATASHSSPKNSTSLPAYSPKTQATSSAVKAATAGFWGKDVIVSDDGWVRTVTNKKYNYSFNCPYDYQIDQTDLKQSPESFDIGDLIVTVATGTVDQLNSDFRKSQGPISNLKITTLKDGDGKIGYVQYYEGEDAVKDYNFIISLKGGKKVLSVRMYYQGAFDPSSMFASIISTVRVN